MVKVTIVQVVYNSKKFIEPVFSAIFKQTFKDFHVVAVISGNDDGGKELLQTKFPQVEIIDPRFNIGFAKGHNLVFSKYDSEFFQLVNPDMIMEPDYIEKMLLAFKDTKVGAATGKLYKISESGIANHELWKKQNSQFILDTTGVVIYKSGRARDRGQHEEDRGQYDMDTSLQAVSGAGCMYRRAALESIKLATASFSLTHQYEYFDEDFHSYWEDVDLSWRMSNAGWKNIFVPSAVGFHGRTAGSSKKGYKDIFGFIKHHKNLSSRIRQLNYQDHIFMYLKNSKWFYPQFFVREFFMFIFILFFEIGTLRVLPNFVKLLPKMWGKRRIINSYRK